MADTFSKKKRSEIMSKIKSKDTRIEIAFRKLFSGKGLRYRKSPSNYFGKPDIVFKKYKVAIFIDSCFWHGCKKHCRIPATNRKYWINKIERNKERDKEVNGYYKKLDWKIFRIWEHEIKRGRDKAINNQRITMLELLEEAKTKVEKLIKSKINKILWHIEKQQV